MIAYGVISINEELSESFTRGGGGAPRTVRYVADLWGENPRRNFVLEMTAPASTTPDGALDNMRALLRAKNVVLLPPDKMPQGGE